MKKLLGIIVLGLLLSNCSSTIEPIDQKDNPIKSSKEVKIFYSDPNEIFIMHNQNPLSLNSYAGYVRPKEEYIKTAFNHCSLYKKNTYFLYKVANNFTQFDYRKYFYNGVRYSGYRFICEQNSYLSRNKIKTYSLKHYNQFLEYLFESTQGSLSLFEKKRILSEQEIAENKKKELEEKARIAKLEKQRRVALIESLENEYGNVCLKNENNNKFLKGTIDYENCLIAHDEKIIAQKREADELRKQKQRELEEKLAKMSPTERHAYNCTETFNFKKGSEKFNDCVFELYTAELDIQKLELEKQVAEANAKAASNEQLRAEALAKAQIAAANASARAANLNSSMQLMKLSEQLIKGNQQQNPFNQNNVRVKTTCTNVGGYLTCF
jgi:hypothetical protein